MAIFPGAVSTDSDLYIAVNQTTTQLTDNPLTVGATTVNVVSATAFPTVGFISIDAEIIKYTGKTGTSFTGCTRGADGTTAASHAQNSQVYHNVIAVHHNASKDEIIAIENNLSSRIGLSATQILALNGSAAAPTHSFTNDSDTGMYRSNTNQIGFATGGLDRLFIDDNAITGNKPAQFLDGTAAVPAYSFFSDTDTGIYSITANAIGISTGGGTRLEIYNTSLTMNVPIFGIDGTAASPAYTFTLDPDNGIWRPATNTIGIATAGVDRLRINVDFFPTDDGTMLLGKSGNRWSKLHTVGIVGTTTNNNAASGDVGEYIEAEQPTATNAPTSGQWGDLTSISLTAGDWDVSGMVNWLLNGSTSTDVELGIKTTAGNSAPGDPSATQYLLPPTATANSSGSLTIRLSLSGTTTVYLKYLAAYSAGTPQARGHIHARRVR